MQSQKELNDKKAFWKSIDVNSCKGQVTFSHTYGELDYTCYLEKNFKMKGKYVQSFLALIYKSDNYSDDYIKMLPVEYVNCLHDDHDYLVSLDNYGNFIETNVFDVTINRIYRTIEKKRKYKLKLEIKAIRTRRKVLKEIGEERGSPYDFIFYHSFDFYK